MNLIKKHSFLIINFIFIFCLFLNVNIVFASSEDSGQQKPVDALFKNPELQFYSDEEHTQEIGKITQGIPQENEFTNTSESLQQRCNFLNKQPKIYNNQRKQLTSRCFDDNGDINYNIDQTYDIGYNNDNNKIKETFFQSDGKTIAYIQEFDPETKKLIKATKFQSDGTTIAYIQEFDPETEELIKETYYNDDNGKTIEYIQEFDPQTNNCKATKYKPDGVNPLIIIKINPQNGKKIKHTKFQNDENKVEFTNEYDPQTGNLTKQTTFKTDGKTIDQIFTFDPKTGLPNDYVVLPKPVVEQQNTLSINNLLINKITITINNKNNDEALAAIKCNNPQLQENTTLKVEFPENENFVIVSDSNYSGVIEVPYILTQSSQTTSSEINTTNTDNQSFTSSVTQDTAISNSTSKNSPSTRTPTTEPKKESFAWLWLLLGIVVVLSAGSGGSYYYMKKNRRTKRK